MNNMFLGKVVLGLTALAVVAAHAQFALTPIPGLPPVNAGSVVWGDYDNDGRMDFVVTGSLQLSIWHNTGNGFSNVTATIAPGMPGLYDSSVAWGDFDNDGRLDLLITGLTNVTTAGVSQLWRNTGGGFTNVPIPGLPGIQSGSVAWSDFDGDGRLDFLISGSTNGPAGTLISQLWRNTGTGFTNVPIPGVPAAWLGSVAWGDYDNDGRPDFLLTGLTNGGPGVGTTQLWRNTGNGFTNVQLPGVRGVFNSSIAWADFNNDGLLDFLVAGFAANTLISEVWQNTGNGFTNVPVAGLPGISDGALAWGDFDNDGRPDFLLTGLPIGGLEISQLWRNTGGGFTNFSVPGLPGHFSSSLAWADFDNDGRLDFLVTGISGNDIVSQLWRNTGAGTNSAPEAPTGLSAIVSNGTTILSWSAPVDDHTPAAGLSYNVRVGTTPGGSDIVSAPALANGNLLLPRMGFARNGSAILHQHRPGQTYYWSVQAVDSAFAGSPFAAEHQFSTAGASNDLSYFFTNTPVWDITGTYQLSSDDTNLVMATLVHNANGKLSGMRSQSFDHDGQYLEGNEAIIGHVFSTASSVKHRLGWRGTLDSAGQQVRAIAIGHASGIIVSNPLGIQLDSSARTCIVHGHCTTVREQTLIPLAPEMNGQWSLAIDFTKTNKTRLTGRAIVTLSNGRSLNYHLSGSYSSRKQSSVLNLKGQGDAAGSQLLLSTVGTVFRLNKVRGRLLGQAVKFP